MKFWERVGDMFKENEGYEDEEETFGVEEEETAEEFETAAATPASAPKTTGVGSSASLEMKVVKPDKVDSAFSIGDHLLAHRTVVINFEDTNRETMRRILDVLGGVVFAIEGNIKKVSDSTYIATPKHVDVTTDAAAKAEEPKTRDLF